MERQKEIVTIVSNDDKVKDIYRDLYPTLSEVQIAILAGQHAEYNHNESEVI